MSPSFNYFDRWRGTCVECSCGCPSVMSNGTMELYQDRMALECSACGATLATVSFPSEGEIAAAAARGDAEATKIRDRSRAFDLGMRRKAAAAADETPFGRLTDLSTLPDLVGGPHAFIWDPAAEGDVAEVRCGDLVLWREHGCVDGCRRFDEVKDLLKERYGSQFRRLLPRP